MNTSSSLQVGLKYLVRTVTHYYTGEVVSITDTDIVLMNASWIADTGRFHVALRDGVLKEVEPYPGEGQVIIQRMAIVDTSEWMHELPRTAK